MLIPSVLQNLSWTLNRHLLFVEVALFPLCWFLADVKKTTTLISVTTYKSARDMSQSRVISLDIQGTGNTQKGNNLILVQITAIFRS